MREKKTFLKLFLDPIKGQEKWLNEQAKRGWRLTRVGAVRYEFEQTEHVYNYVVEFIGNYTNKERLEYQNRLEKQGIRFFNKGINSGKISFGNIKWRPFANRGGKIAISGGMINSELIILEKPLKDVQKQSEQIITENPKHKNLSSLHYSLLLAMIFLALTLIISEPSIFSFFSYSNIEKFSFFDYALKIGNVVLIVWLALLSCKYRRSV